MIHAAWNLTVGCQCGFTAQLWPGPGQEEHVMTIARDVLVAHLAGGHDLPASLALEVVRDALQRAEIRVRRDPQG